MKFEKNDHIYGIWYGEFPDGLGNILIVLVNRDNNYIIEKRLRIYKEDGSDEKVFYQIDLKTNDTQQALEKITTFISISQLAATDVLGGFTNYDFVLIDGDVEKFVEVFQKNKKPWMHMTVKKA